MKFSSPVLFAAFLVGVAVAEKAGSANHMGAQIVKRQDTDQEKAEKRAEKDAAKAQRAAEKDAARSLRDAEKAAAATATDAVSLIHIDHLDT